MTFYHKTNFETKKKLDFQLISWEEVVPELTLLYTGGGTECPPHQLWSLVALSRRFGLVQFQCTFGHMDALSALSTKKVLKIVFELV